MVFDKRNNMLHSGVSLNIYVSYNIIYMLYGQHFQPRSIFKTGEMFMMVLFTNGWDGTNTETPFLLP